jgi:hypothetical protein
LIEKWVKLSTDLEAATQTEVQRRYFPLLSSWPSNVVLHIFVDASTTAYGTVAYVTSNSHSSMVMSKSRVAPLKKLTLPQLELMAAVTGSRLASYLSNHLKVTKIVFWSDSQIVIYWLSSQKDLKCFIQNRVKEIHQATNNATWNYCPTSDNPADLLTRGISADDLSKSNLWTHGPPWLTNHDHWLEWKPNNILLQSSLDKDQETSEVTAEVTDTSTNASITQIIAPTKFSDLQRLLRTTTWVLRFVNALKKDNVCKGKPLKVHEVENARNVWIREIQNDAYGNELASIQKPKTSRLPLVRQLRLFTLEDNIIRCGGRIHNAPVEHSANIKTSPGHTNRPVTKLYPLEVKSNSTTTEKPKITIDGTLDAKNPSTNPHPADVIVRKSSRPVRAKARLAKEKLKQWTSILSRPPEDVEN